MLPVLGGEGSKSAKQSSTLISKLFGRSPSKGPIDNNVDSDAESPRSTGRAGSGSLQAPGMVGDAASAAAPSKSWIVSPRQAGAAATTGMTPAASKEQAPGSLLESKSRKVLFAGPSAKKLEAAAEAAGNGRVAAMLDHNHAFKRSHTTDLSISANSQRTLGGAKLTPLSPTAAAIANVGSKGSKSPTTAARNKAASITAEEALNLPADALEYKSEAELKKLFETLQRETLSLKKQAEELDKKKSGSGSGRSPSLVVEFAEPRHQQRPSMIAANLEQIKAGLAHPPDSKPRVSLMPAAATTSAASTATRGSMEIDEEDSGFMEDDSERQRMEEEAKKRKQQKQREAEAAAAAAASKPPVSPTKAAAPQQQQPPRKYKLLSIYALLPPHMRREEWSLAHFQIDKKLHAGYASEVYRAKDAQSSEMLAVKVYNLAALGELNKVQLIREIRLHGSFAHRNIIELYTAFQEGNRVVLAQRYAEGGDLLKALHKAGGRLTEKSAVQMVIQPLLNCLAYLHGKGVTHRDIKPENILFDGEGVLKLADFGLAINMTEENAVTRAGTLHYMAPEVVKNPLKDHPDDYKSDARFHYNAVVDSWAVGCLAYELIIGFPPFMADTQQQVVKNINSMEVRYPKKMTEECIDFVKWALQREPQNRATTGELIKHPWIGLHMRRNSSRQLNFEPQAPVARMVTDFKSSAALTKAHNAAHRAADHGPGKSKEGSKMAPF